MDELRALRNFAIACLLAAVVVVPLSWSFGWYTVPFQVTSAGNVREQWRFAYDFEEDLKAAAIQVCNAEKALTAAQNAEERSQRQSQLTARQDNFSRIASDYNAALRDKFRANIVAPPDVQRQAPALNDVKRSVC